MTPRPSEGARRPKAQKHGVHVGGLAHPGTRPLLGPPDARGEGSDSRGAARGRSGQTRPRGDGQGPVAGLGENRRRATRRARPRRSPRWTARDGRRVHRCAPRSGSGGATMSSRLLSVLAGKHANSTRQPRTLPWTNTTALLLRPSWRASTRGPGDASITDAACRVVHRRVRADLVLAGRRRAVELDAMARPRRAPRSARTLRCAE